MNALAVLLANVVNRADVGMVQRRGRLRLSLKTRECLRVPGNLLRQKLQRHEAVKPSVLRLVDHTHATAAKLFDECGNARSSGRLETRNLAFSRSS